MIEDYHIQLKPDAQKHAVCTPHRILLPLMFKVKDEIDQLYSLVIIECVDMLTEWCVLITVVPQGQAFD